MLLPEGVRDMSDWTMAIGPWTFRAVTQARWDDLVQLFAKESASNECWCMWWRIKRSDWQRQVGEGNKRAMQAIVASGEVPGLLAYEDGAPVGWCSVAPRERFPVLDRSPVLKRVDGLPVWSVVCFFVDEAHRGRGLSAALLQAAIAYARRCGAQTLEAYPRDPVDGQHIASSSAFVGVTSIFRRAGFVEVARRSPQRPIMRLRLSPGPDEGVEP